MNIVFLSLFAFVFIPVKYFSIVSLGFVHHTSYQLLCVVCLHAWCRTDLVTAVWLH